MLGLIKKDLLLLKTNTKIFIGIIFFYIIFGLSADIGPAMAIAMIAMIMSMQVLSTMQWDEQFKWNPYALTMPVSRKILVISKYILSAITVIIGILFGMICAVITSLVKSFVFNSPDNFFTIETPITALVIFSVMLLVNAILLPAIYKFGVEKARLLLIILIAIPAFIITGIAQYIINPNATKPVFINTLIAWCSEHLLDILPVIAAIFLIAAIAVSCMISIKILEKKEF